MFYSQFILAKKGPLGTIWIAAHLERKLRKNQVADTDIGVSVDSILFPEVPIALRLSSHLLLGVVRIYSRKVNYLFNDCSETLVKIKQAFHSTVVDLPPEASTAPYHSITLPETFDLDDLELPESSFSHGNFVDHHVTTREQITLQDPVEDTIYLGSQFGLDERFGDGDAPQIGLDFDEDLFADQLCSPGPSSAATHLEEDVLPSVLGAEGRILKKREIEGQESSIPAADSSHLDEEKTRDHSTMQPLVDYSGQMDVDIPNILPPPVVDVVRVSSKEIHTPDLNKEIFPCSTLQGPSTPRLTDETLNAEAEEVPISSSLQKIQLFNMAKGIPVVTSQTFAPASCLVSGLSTGLEQVEKSLSSQDCRPALTILQFEEKRESYKIPNKEQVQPDENCLKEQLLAQNESIRKETPQRRMMFQTHEDVNLFPRPNPVQPVMMQTSKEMPAVDLNSQSTSSSICSLAMPTVPSPHVHYELNVTKQHPPIQEIQASTSSMQLANTVCKAHDMSTLALQQLNEVGDGKKQLHLASGSQGLVQISQMHHNQMLHTPVQQNPIAMQTFSTSLSGQQYSPASRLQSAVGISGTQQLAIHDPPASATVVPHMKEVSPTEFQQKNNVAESKQQSQFSAGTQEYSRMTNMQSSTMNTYVHQHSIGMHTFPTYVSGQQFNLASGCHSTVGMSSTQEFPSPPTTAISNAQNVPSMENSQHLYQMAGSQQQLCLEAATQECVELTQRENVGVNTTAQEFNQPMRVFPVSGEHLNKSFGHQSADSMLDTQQIPTLGNTSGPAHVASQKFWSPQRFHVPETSIEVSNVATIEGPWLHACNEETKRHQSISSIHEAQHGGSKTGESAAIFPSSDMQRIPTSFSIQNTYPQSTSFSIPTGVQGASKGMLDGSIAAQSISLIHGTQPVGSKTGESASTFTSSDMQRIPTNVPVQNTYPQSTSFSILTGAQGVSKGIVDGSIAAQSISSIHGAQHGGSKTRESTAIIPSSDMQRIPMSVPVQNTYPESASFSMPTGVQGASKGIQDGNIAAQSISSIHGVQHGCSKTGESAAIFTSSDMQRIPTNVPVQNTYPQSGSFSIPTGVQGVSKGILDGSLAAKSISSIHGAQHGGAKPGESAAIFQSSNMQRTPTNVPIQHVYPQSASFFIPTGVQGVSKGVPDGSIAGQSISLIHGAQYGGSKIGESAPIFPSSDMQRIPTDVPIQNVYPQSTSFSIATGMQGVSKGMLDGSIAAQHRNFPLEKETWQSHADALSGNIFQGISFPLQAPTLGTCADVPSRNILQPCSFPTHAETNGVYSNAPSESMLLQDNYFPKVTESDGFLSNVTASKKSAPATFQHQAFSNASDELSNALSINQAQDVIASKGKQFETMQPHLETIRRSEPEIHAHETLRSSYNVGRNEPDIFGLKQPMTANETPREADKNTLTSKQSVGSRKRHMMDTTPVVKESIPKSRSRLSLSNRSLDYIPHDDDVLASILGRTPSFKIKPTPVETVTAKRRRSTPRTTGRKRKALIDIAMVIHGDVIRQQLANTEDIRRVRKKAPCTPQEIRMIQKESQAHYIFFEPSIPGICMELQDLYGQVFGLTEGKLPQVGKNENFTETQKEREPISSLEPTNDSRMVQLEQAERPLEIVSEMESGEQHKGNVHANEVHMDYFDGSRVHMDDDHGKQEQGRPLDTVSEILSTSLRMNNAHDKQQPEKSVEMGFAVESRRVHMDDFHKEQEQERLQMFVTEVESGRVRAYDNWQNQEQQLQTIVCEVESSQVHTGDVRQKIERPWMVVSDIELGRVLPSIESSRVFTVAVHQKEDQERSQGMASEIESGRVHTLDVHQKQEREQERPRGIVLEIESSRVHAYDVQGKQSSIEAFPKTPINVVIGSEVSNVNKALESSMVQQGHTLSEIESSRGHTLNVHRNQEREQERPQQILSEIESIREHAYDVQGRQASIKALPENSINVITDSEVSNVKKTLESSMVQQGHALSEMESSRVHTLDVHRNQEREQEMPQQILLEMESGRVHAYDIQGKQASIEALPENHINVITGSDISNVRKTVESSMVQQGQASLEIESSRVHRPQEIVFEIESNRVHAYGVQGKQASVEALPENPINAIAGSEISNVEQTLESTVVQQGHAFTNQVFVPQGITFKDYQVQGLQGSSALEGGCHNIREIYLSSHQFPLKSSCFSANQEMPLEIKRGSHVLTEKHGVVAQDMEVSQCLAEKHGAAVRDLEVSQFLAEKHGVAVQDMEVSQCLAEKHGVDVQDMEVSQCLTGNYRVNEGEKILSEDLEVAVMKKDGSNCLVENHGIHMVHTKEGTNMESISEVIKIDDERELRNKEQNIAQDRREQSREITVIGTIEETVKDCESQRQTVCYSPLISVQGKDSVPNNIVHTGDLRNLNTTINTSVQNSGAENTMQDEQVLVYEKSTKMSCNEAEAHGDVALRDREGQDGLNQIDQTVTDDEEFEFLGVADDTEFLEGDGNAQDEFDGKTKAPGTEEDHIQENSGWSARTRAVSRYLKTAFEGMDYDSKKPEAENRQKLSLDHLLMGKRRKEAARMFFETLVLKTRDYVNVEQKDSFDDISIYPRAKLMNTIF